MSSPSPDPVRRDLRALLDRITGGTAFRDDQDVFTTGVVRSINLLELIVGVEDTYGIVVDERDVFAGHLRSVDQLVAFVHGRVRVAS
jgi:acyl carrier protein